MEDTKKRKAAPNKKAKGKSGAAKWQKKGKAQAKDKSSQPEDAWIKRLYGSSMYNTIKTTTQSTVQNWLWMSDKGTERVIIHIDLDCFYVQVEVGLQPKLAGHAVGVQQRNSVVTSNYAARAKGISKMEPVYSALKKCPELILVPSVMEHYRTASKKVFEIFRRFSPLVEGLSIDEAYIDITALVDQRLREGPRGSAEEKETKEENVKEKETKKEAEEENVKNVDVEGEIDYQRVWEASQRQDEEEEEKEREEEDEEEEREEDEDDDSVGDNYLQELLDIQQSCFDDSQGLVEDEEDYTAFLENCVFDDTGTILMGGNKSQEREKKAKTKMEEEEKEENEEAEEGKEENVLFIEGYVWDDAVGKIVRPEKTMDNYLTTSQTQQLALCDIKLIVGSQIASKIRSTILKELGYTCSVGVAHNKLLAKIVSGLNKPDNQSIIPHSSVAAYLRKLPISKVPKIGGVTAQDLKEMNVSFVADILPLSEDALQRKFGFQKGTWLHRIARGIDDSAVKDKGPPKSVSVESSFSSRMRNYKDAEVLISERAEELVRRLDEDDAFYDRHPRSLVLKYSLGFENSVTRSIAMPLLPPSASHATKAITKQALALLQGNIKPDQLGQITRLGLGAGNFAAGGRASNGTITQFFAPRSSPQKASLDRTQLQ